MATLNRRAEAHGNATVLVILLLMTAMIIFYAISVNPQQREELFGSKLGGYTRDFLNVQPGFLQGVTEEDMEIDTHSLSMINVDYGPEKTSKLLASSLDIKKSVTSEEVGEYSISISKTNLGMAELVLKVTAKEGEGNIVVTLNSRTIYDAPLDLGEDEVIDLPLDMLLEGENKIGIYASSSGKFWQANSYRLSGVAVNLGIYTGTNAVKTETFTLSSEELGGFVEAKYQAFVKQGAEKRANLKIEANEYVLYNKVPAEQEKIEAELPKYILKEGNEMRWSVEKDGVYDIEFSKIIVTTAPETNFEAHTFKIDSTTYIQLAAGNYDCKLTLAKEGGEEAKVNLNGHVLHFDLSQGTETKDVCQYLAKGTNSLIVSAEDEDVDLSQLTLTVASK